MGVGCWVKGSVVLDQPPDWVSTVLGLNDGFTEEVRTTPGVGSTNQQAYTLDGSEGKQDEGSGLLPALPWTAFLRQACLPCHTGAG